VELSMGSRARQEVAWCDTEAYKKAPYPRNLHLQRTIAGFKLAEINMNADRTQ
jgi:hypothetical protein